MKNLFNVSVICGIALSFGSAQAQTYHYPPNPDFNYDGYVNSRDLLDFLPLFETQWGPLEDYEPQDYDFPDFEQTIYDVLNNEIRIDSIYVFYEVSAVHEWYPIGDPELQVDTIVYSRELVLQNINGPHANVLNNIWRTSVPDGGGQISFLIHHSGNDSGLYQVRFTDGSATLNYLFSIGFLTSVNGASMNWHITDEPSGMWTMDDNGWHWHGENFLGQTLTAFECYPYISEVEN